MSPLSGIPPSPLSTTQGSPCLQAHATFTKETPSSPGEAGRSCLCAHHLWPLFITKALNKAQCKDQPSPRDPVVVDPPQLWSRFNCKNSPSPCFQAGSCSPPHCQTPSRKKTCRKAWKQLWSSSEPQTPSGRVVSNSLSTGKVLVRTRAERGGTTAQGSRLSVLYHTQIPWTSFWV